jgi:hypothetical protein
MRLSASPCLSVCRYVALKNSRTCKSVFFYFVHRLYFNKITTFRKLDLLPSSGKKKEINPSCWAPWLSYPQTRKPLLQIITHHRQKPLDFTSRTVKWISVILRSSTVQLRLKSGNGKVHYTDTRTRFYEHIERNSLNIYKIEKCFKQKL